MFDKIAYDVVSDSAPFSSILKPFSGVPCSLLQITDHEIKPSVIEVVSTSLRFRYSPCLSV